MDVLMLKIAFCVMVGGILLLILALALSSGLYAVVAVVKVIAAPFRLLSWLIKGRR
jgi:hypothetical protein